MLRLNLFPSHQGLQLSDRFPVESEQDILFFEYHCRLSLLVMPRLCLMFILVLESSIIHSKVLFSQFQNREHSGSVVECSTRD